MDAGHHEPKIQDSWVLNMKFSGWQKVSLIDYPGLISTVLFTPGCSFRCRFCHNPSLVIPPYQPTIKETHIIQYLSARQGLIQGVVITGGEPLIQKDLKTALTKIKDLGYQVKLDTNGYHPDGLRELLDAGLVDYLAMDLKAPLTKYPQITQQPRLDVKKIRSSIQLIMTSNIPHEFRTTLIENFHTLEDIHTMSELIQGARLYYLQKFITQPQLVDEAYSHFPTTTDEFLIQAQKIALKYVTHCQTR